MKALIVGCGRVGSAIAMELDQAGCDVVVLDENEEALERLGDGWRKGFVVGHALELSVLEEAGIADADAFIAATNGDNTNIVVAQIAKLRYGVESVAARIHDPARADFYAGRGIEIVSPARSAIDGLTSWALAAGAPH
jgi:trk system potassium uptake protein TrkA